MLQIGERIPEFTLEDDTGMAVRSEDLPGDWTVLYFYPKDDTPGCTTEACSFRDNLPDFETSKARIIGISGDNQASHASFKEKYNLPYTLLSDPNHIVHEMFGVWDKQNGTSRTTFIIDPDLIIREVFIKVNPENHATQVKAALDRVTN